MITSSSTSGAIRKERPGRLQGSRQLQYQPHVKDDLHWFWIEARFFNFQVREDRQDAFNRALEEQGITEDRVKQVTKEKQDDEDFFLGGHLFQGNERFTGGLRHSSSDLPDAYCIPSSQPMEVL